MESLCSRLGGFRIVRLYSLSLLEPPYFGISLLKFPNARRISPKHVKDPTRAHCMCALRTCSEGLREQDETGLELYAPVWIMLPIWSLTALFFELAWATMFCKTSFMVTHCLLKEQSRAPFYTVLSIWPLQKTSEN